MSNVSEKEKKGKQQKRQVGGRDCRRPVTGLDSTALGTVSRAEGKVSWKRLEVLGI